MKLHEVPRETNIIHNGVELFFDHVDGMYSFCIDEKGNIVHLAAFADVEIKENSDV